jgi:hypothetical protein
MKIVYNDIIPFGSYLAINVFGVVFVKRKYKNHFTRFTRNHEYVHTLQMRELLFVPFYLWYVVEWIAKLLWYADSKKAYKSISFEREANANERDDDYPSKRKHYAFTQRLFK